MGYIRTSYILFNAERILEKEPRKEKDQSEEADFKEK